MFYFTGDLHGKEYSRLNNKNFIEQELMTRNDYVIVTGDCGIIWDNSKSDKNWIKWFGTKNYTLIFADGNHENFDLLKQYEVKIWNGGKIHRISENIIHLMRGQIYNINDKKFFIFGGAQSTDIEYYDMYGKKKYRKEGKDWWKDELPSDEEYKEGLENLAKNNWEVDYVISHTCPTETLKKLAIKCGIISEQDILTDYLETIDFRLKYEHWYFGHFHRDIEITNNKTCIYKKIIKVI